MALQEDGLVTIEQWLVPVSEEKPSGETLEYDPDFKRMEEAAREEADAEFKRDDGEITRREGKQADWVQVQALAERLLLRSKDLRLAVWLTRAWLHTRGFAGIGDGLALIAGLLDTFWPTLHPELDPGDEDSPAVMRANALLELASLQAVVRDLRGSLVFQSRRHGQLAVREIEIALGRLKPTGDKPPLSESQLAEVLGYAVAENPDLPRQADFALAGVQTVRRCFADRSGESAPDLAPLQSVLYAVTQAVKLVAPPVVAAAESPPPEDDEAPTESRAPAPVRSAPGEILSRDDVVATLDRLCDYLARHEPTNPVPLLLRRAQRMMGMSFLELMEDMAPDGLPQAETVVGEKLHKDEDE